MITLGIDAHKRTHTVVAVDGGLGHPDAARLHRRLGRDGNAISVGDI